MSDPPRDSWQLHSVFQPVVDLHTGVVVGAEVFSRDSTGQDSIVELIQQARADDTIELLDRVCRTSAIDTWLAAGMTTQLTLFLNVEPSGLLKEGDSTADRHFDDLQRSGARVVVEITERDLLQDPQALMMFRRRVTERGWELAIDDIGADPLSLAMLPLLAPEVMKLDMLLLHRHPNRLTAQTINAVLAQAERTGATILAEGIETSAHLELALSVGATLGQGWLFGRPSVTLPPEAERDDSIQSASSVLTSVSTRSSSAPITPRWAPVLPAPRDADAQPRRPATAKASDPAPPTPWQLVGNLPTVRRARKPILAAMSAHIERQISDGDPATIVLGSFQDVEHIPRAVLKRYAKHARTAAFVGILGSGLESEPAPGVRGHNIDQADPLIVEWTVIVITPDRTVALIARETTDTRDPTVREEDRQFEYLFTCDRNLVLEAARTIMTRFPGKA